jgi:signal transduction histidine kinase
MQRIGHVASVRSALSVTSGARRIGCGAGRSSDPDGDFAAILLAMAGHDLRQPLQVITNAHDILARILDTDAQRKELAEAVTATARLNGMLTQLVEALELRERARDELHAAVPLRPIFDQLAAEFAEAARQKEITLLVSAASHAVFSHPFLLTGMLRNLIRNAIDYTPEGGGVFVTARCHGSRLRIEVRDTGVGIPSAALARIFGAFQRADRSRPDGLGLGLFIVNRLADVLQHQLEVRSAEGRGSSFIIVADVMQRSASRRTIAPFCRHRAKRNGLPALSYGGTAAHAAVLP